MSFLKRTGAEIVISFIKNEKKSFFLLKKLKSTSSAQLWASGFYTNNTARLFVTANF